MTRDVFIDTSAFIALLNKKDDFHSKAAQIIKAASRQQTHFITTDYILDETLTLLKARGCGHIVPVFIDLIFHTRACQVIWMDSERFSKVTAFFQKHQDKQWSFTDCFSFVCMKECRITKALTKDHHFSQAGFDLAE